MKKFLLVLLVVLVVAGIVLYLLANHVPAEYKPIELTAEQRHQVANDFAAHVAEFWNKSQVNESFTWSISQEELNSVLSSLDDVRLWTTPSASPSQQDVVKGGMARLEIADPAVAIQDGTITLMIRSIRYSKVFSATLGLSMQPDGRLKVTLASAHMGSLPVPKSLVRDVLTRMAGSLPQSAARKHSGSPVNAEDLAAMMRALLAAVDGDPVVPEFNMSRGKRVRIQAIDLGGRNITLHVMPVGRPLAAPPAE